MLKLGVFLVTLAFFAHCPPCLSVTDEETTEPVLVFVVFRHGERVPSPNEVFPTEKHPFSSFYPLTWGEITNSGKHRQYTLGKKLRKKYDSFLGKVFHLDSVAALSTNFSRTQISTLVMLAGLFPPHESQIFHDDIRWLPIPYSHEGPGNEYLLQRPNPYCPRYVEELENVLASEQIKTLREKYQPVFDYVTKSSGKDMFDFHEMFRIYQNLNIKLSLNMTIPDWSKSVYPEPLQTIASYQCVFENYNDILKRLNGGHIMGKFIEIAKQKSTATLDPPERKMYLYSGHENNIVNILSVLGLFKQHIPTYCSAVMLELHKNKSNQYGFKVFYDNDTYADGSHLLTIPGCETFCELEKFVNLTKKYIPVNYTAECESEVFLD